MPVIAPAVAADVKIFALSPYDVQNWGASTTNDLSNYATDATGAVRSLYKINVSAVPAGQIIVNSFTLSQVIQDNTLISNYACSGYPMILGSLAESVAFVEGTKNGATPADGANWTTSDGTTAFDNAGGDYDDDGAGRSTFNINAPATDAIGSTKVLDLTATMQYALDNGLRFGDYVYILLRRDTEGIASTRLYRFYSNQWSNPAQYPSASLDYTVAGGQILGRWPRSA